MKNKEEKVAYPDSAEVESLNKFYSKSQVFSDYTWKGNLHPVPKVNSNTESNFSEIYNLLEKSSRYNLEPIGETKSPFKSIGEPSEGFERKRISRKPLNSTESIKSHLESLEKAKSTKEVLEKSQKLISEVPSRQLFSTQKFDFLLKELFTADNVLSETTTKKNREFYKKAQQFKSGYSLKKVKEQEDSAALQEKRPKLIKVTTT